MLHVTAQAQGYLRALHEQIRAPRDQSFRISQLPNNRLAIVMSLAEDGDEVIFDQRGPILIIAATLSSPMDGMTLDVVPRTEGNTTFLELDLLPAPPAARAP
jgi:hypothetical protein